MMSFQLLIFNIKEVVKNLFTAGLSLSQNKAWCHVRVDDIERY